MSFARLPLADRFREATIELDRMVLSEQNPAKQSLYRFLRDQCQHAQSWCEHAYSPENVNMEWDAVNMLNDRYPGSLSGGLAEIALMIDSRFDAYGVPVPVLDKHRQVRLGLDFTTGEKTHQVKSGIVSLTGGAIKVTPDLFDTTADYVHILTRWKGSAIWYSASTLIWMLILASEAARYADEKQPNHFTFEREDMLRLGVAATLTYDWATT